MKRKGYLYPKLCDIDLIETAIYKASNGKRKRRDVRRILNNSHKYALDIQEKLLNKTFEPSDFRTMVHYDGIRRKERIIYKPPYFPDQIVHWCIYLVLRDWLYAGFYKYACGSIPGRGVHYGKAAVEKWLKSDRKNTKYYLKMDVRKFYPSVKAEPLMRKLRTKIKDEDLLNIIHNILIKNDGLPIGMLLSQVFANFFLTDFDYYVKQDLGAKYYIRYMDDMVIFGSNKKKLHKMRREISERLAVDGLSLKDNWQVCKLSKEPLDFMGFRFYQDHTTLRKSVMLRITRKVRKVGHKDVPTRHDAQAVISYLGWVKHSDSYKLFITWIRPYLHIQQLKDIIRRSSRNENLQFRICNQAG